MVNMLDIKGIKLKGKSVDKGFIALYHKKISRGQLSVACVWRESTFQECVCFSDDFLAVTKGNHFSALKQSGNIIVGTNNQWISEDKEQEVCGFHSLLVRSCGKCSNNGGSDNFDHFCSGKAFSTRKPLKCKQHSFLYVTECNRVAEKAQFKQKYC